MLAEGQIQELKKLHDCCYELRLKAEPERFARRLLEAGCDAEHRDDLLIVRLPAGRNERLIWDLAVSSGEQIRYLRPQRSTLEEVFLLAVEEK